MARFVLCAVIALRLIPTLDSTSRRYARLWVQMVQCMCSYFWQWWHTIPLTKHSDRELMAASLVWNYYSSRHSHPSHFFPSFLSHVLACRAGRALINHASLFFTLWTVHPSTFIELQVKPRTLDFFFCCKSGWSTICCVWRSSVPVLRLTHFSVRWFRQWGSDVNIPLQEMHPNAPVLLSRPATEGSIVHRLILVQGRVYFQDSIRRVKEWQGFVRVQ